MADLSVQPDSEASPGTPGDGPQAAKDQFPYGLEVLHEPTPPPLHPVQIVFVHGLNGSKRRTWTHGKTEFWPLWLKELKGMEVVRLSIFGYNSSTNILKPNTNLSIPIFAGQLLRYLTQLSYKNGSAATVFVAHSLGGLVVKEAIVQAHNDPEYASLSKCVKGVVFLGTPHRGTDFAKTLDRVLLASFSSRKFVQQLHPRSDAIAAINKGFAHRVTSLRVISFFETENTRLQWWIPMGKMIVPESSATLGYPNEITHGMNGDHFGIAKYSSKDDPNFVTISTELHKLVSKLLAETHVPRALPETRNAAGPPTPKVFLMPYERNPHFVGREDILKLLRGMLQETIPRKYNHRVAIHGMGGVGKTQVAIGYVYEYQNDYDNMYWVSASDQTALLSGFGKMAAQTKCLPPGMEAAKPTDVATVVLTWLRTQRNWLLVIDNLDDISIADGFLPALDSGGHTLITTRNPDVKTVPAEGFEIPVLGHAVAVELLRLRSDADAHDSDIGSTANDIVKQLGYLPLAIDYAAAFIRSTSSDLSTFLQIFHRSRKEVLSRTPTSKHTYPNSIAAMFLLSFNKIKENPIYGAQASRLLELFAFLNPDGILIDFLDAGSSGLNGELREIVDNKLVFNESLGLLRRFSLIGRARRAITVHRLVQAVLIDNLEEPEVKYCWTGVIKLCLAAWPEIWDTQETRGLCRNFQSQVMEPALKAAELPSKDAAVTLGRISRFLWDDGDWKDSERFAFRSYEILSSLLGSDDQDTLTSMNNLAVTYRAQGRSLEAAEMQERDLEICKRMLGEEHPDTLTSMNNLALTYQGQGRLPEAAEMHERGLEICKRMLGDEHPDTLTSMSNLATTYWYQERLKDAATLEESVMKARIKTLGGEHPDTLNIMNNLAYTYESLGRATEAVSLMQRSFEGARKVLGEEHPDTIRRTDKFRKLRERSLLDLENPMSD